MWFELGRRISMILLIVAVATGFAVPTVKAGTHHSPMVTGITMSADNPAGCTHEGCPIDHGSDMHGTCFAPCAGATVLPPATAMVHLAVERDVLTPSLDLAVVDRTVAPDPHPPKHTV
jgi:hypothetical protein